MTLKEIDDYTAKMSNDELKEELIKLGRIEYYIGCHRLGDELCFMLFDEEGYIDYQYTDEYKTTWEEIESKYGYGYRDIEIKYNKHLRLQKKNNTKKEVIQLKELEGYYYGNNSIKYIFTDEGYIVHDLEHNKFGEIWKWSEIYFSKWCIIYNMLENKSLKEELIKLGKIECLNGYTRKFDEEGHTISSNGISHKTKWTELNSMDWKILRNYYEHYKCKKDKC